MHEAVLQEIVSSNKWKKLSREVSDDITKGLEFTQKQLEDETKVIKKDTKISQKNLNEVEKDFLDPEDITNKLIELEDRSRRNNLRIDGIEQKNKDSSKNCEELFQKIIKEKLEIEKNIEIDNKIQRQTIDFKKFK